MLIKKLTILVKSDATLTMIQDILESAELFPKLVVYNNLLIPVEHDIYNPKFEIVFESEILQTEKKVLGVFNTQTKLKLIKSVNPNQDEFINLIHKSCEFSKTVKLGIGIIVNSLTSIAAHSEIGNYVSINRNVSIGHHSKIGDYTTINPGVNIGGHTIIGNNTTIGMGSNIFNNVKVGKNTIIGGGSLVTKDVPDNVLAYGNPCRIIKNI